MHESISDKGERVKIDVCKPITKNNQMHVHLQPLRMIAKAFCLTLFIIYSRASVAQTLMAHLPWLFGLILESLGKHPLAADLG